MWGLVFLAPALVGGFTPLQLTTARYLFYGLAAAALVAPGWRTLVARIGRAEWMALIWLSLVGNVLYYVLLSNAVQLGGIAMTSLVIGFLPVLVTIAGSRERGAVPLQRLMPSILLCTAGTLCIGWQALALPTSGFVPTQVVGLACAVGALLAWTCYAVGNARWLVRLDNVSAHDWNLLTGVVTGAMSLALVPFSLILSSADHSPGEWAKLAGVAAGLASFASILGNSLWNRMSQLLPLALVGQMILFETLFALFYGFLWERRLPTLLEIVAFLFVACGVFSCLRAHRRPAAGGKRVPIESHAG